MERAGGVLDSSENTDSVVDAVTEVQSENTANEVVVD